MKQDLTGQVLAYKDGQLDQETVLRSIAIYLYTFLQHRYQPDEGYSVGTLLLHLPTYSAADRVLPLSRTTFRNLFPHVDQTNLH